MRGLGKSTTCLLAVPAVVGTRAVSDNEVLKANVSVRLPEGENRSSQSLTLLLEESSEICGPARLYLEDQPLVVDAQGSGSGNLRIIDESSIAAHWSVTCLEDDGVPVGQLLEFTVDSVDGDAISTTFSTRFSQISPVTLEQIQVECADDHKPKDGQSTYGTALELIKSKGEVLKEFIAKEEKYIKEHFNSATQEATNSTSTSTSIQECQTWICALHAIKEHLKSTAHQICDSATEVYHELKAPEGWGHPHRRPEGYGETQEEVQTGDEEDMEQSSWSKIWHHPWSKPIMTPLSKAQPSTTTSVATSTPTISITIPLPPADPALLLTLVIASVFFALFSFISLRILHARLTPSIHRETREERLARVSTRRSKIAAFLKRMLRLSFIWRDKDERGVYEAPQGRDVRDDVRGMTVVEDGSMEEELASFRDAAVMVRSIIAAEEGRAQRPQTLVVSPYQQDSQPGYMSDTASLPPYESDESDMSMVANGFQYVPGQMTQAAHSTPVLSGSDRLGYDENKD